MRDDDILEYQTDCPRCKAQATAHIGRRDIGRIERHMHICCECGLVFGVVNWREWKYKASHYFEQKLKESEKE